MPCLPSQCWNKNISGLFTKWYSEDHLEEFAFWRNKMSSISFMISWCWTKPDEWSGLIRVKYWCLLLSLLFTSDISYQAGTRGIPVRCRSRSHGNTSKWEILHPAARGHRELYVHVASDPWPQVPAVGLGSRGGECRAEEQSVTVIEMYASIPN